VKYLQKSLKFSLIYLALLPFCSYANADSDENQQAKSGRLETVKVSADAEVADGPVDGYRAQRSATGTKTDVPLQETPISVQIVTRAVMDDQQVLRIEDAVKNISGVYQDHGPDGNTMDAFIIRGFSLDSYGATYLDGVKDFSRAPKETAGLERIEVLKGPAAIMYGRIEPGGMVNRVSKKPLAESFTNLQQQVGSDNYYRTTLDSNGILTEDQSLLYRVNIAVEDADGFVDDTHNKRTYIAPQIEWVASDQTTIRTGFEYQKNNRSWALTYGTIGDANGPVKIPRSTNLNDKDDYYKDDSLTWQLNWEHQFNDDWKLHQRITYVARNSVAQGSNLSEADSDGNYERTFWGWKDEQAKVGSTNLDLTGKFATGRITHNILIGADYFNEDYDSGGWEFGGTPVISNIHHPDNESAPYDNDYTVMPYWYKNLNRGIYLQDQMTLPGDRLHILIGARHDQANNTYGFGDSGFKPKDKRTTWRGGLLYELSPAVSVYTSYVDGFGASNFSWGSGEIFDPQTSHQYEVGTKIQINSALGVSIAAYELIKDNLPMADPTDITRTILAGEATSKGLELDINGQLTDNWNVIASYAYTDVRYTHSDSMQGERLYGVPRNGASFWSTYKFGNTGWKFGGGINYRGSRLGTQRAWYPDMYPYTMDAYSLVDLMVSYDFTLGKLPVTAQLNVDNATDKTYYPASYGGMDRISLGAPRNILGSARISF
jgi:iron complex outermembrane receptor protein